MTKETTIQAAPPADPVPARRRKADRSRTSPAITDFVLVIGAMKSGTTSLYDYLVTHPEIAACRRKEPSFFAADRGAKLPRRYYRLWPDYDPARHRYAIEASVDYTKQPRYPAVTARIGAFPARFKFLYIVRDPVDRIESHIAHNIAKGRITARNYAERIPSAVEISRYAYQLDAFRRPLGDPEVLVLDFDELRRDPMRLLGRTVDFLGLDPTFAFAPRPASNTRKAAHGAPEFRLSPEERARFRAELAPDMARFARDHGFDVARWGFTPEAFPVAFAAVAAEPPRAPAPKPAAVPASPAPAPAKAPTKAAAKPAPAASGYWERRRDLVYYEYLRRMVARFGARARSLIDVGSHDTPLAEAFDWIPERFALDIRAPWSSAAVTGITADFMTFEPGRRYDFALCSQVLDQVGDPEAFARKLLGIADRVLVSVPYRPGKSAPIDKSTLESWFGRAPDHVVTVQEPFQTGAASRRLIAYYHDLEGEPFSLKAARRARG